MGMMKTLSIVRHETMAPKGFRKYGVRMGDHALVYVYDGNHAREIRDTLNRIKPRNTTVYKLCLGPDHPLVKMLRIHTYPLLGSSENSLFPS